MIARLFIVLVLSTFFGMCACADKTNETVENASHDQDRQHEQDQAKFTTDVAPFLELHCVACHDGDEAEGGIDLAKYEDSANIQNDFDFWEKVMRVLKDRQMPPEDEPQPSNDEFADVLAGIERELNSFDCSKDRRPGRVTMRRLNRNEYNNTVRDLMGVDFQPARDFPSDDVGNGFDNIADVLTISPILMEKYLTAAEQIADRVYADQAALDRLLVHKPGDDLDILEATRRNFRTFASRAFRRPVTDDELSRILGLMISAFQKGLSTEDIGKTGIQAVLASPHFLFRVEQAEQSQDDEDNEGDRDEEISPSGIRRLDHYEIASRLSYFLWSSMPDKQLFDLAEKQKLHDPKVLADQARRMLADSKSKALVDNFAGQWLQLRDLDSLSPDIEKFHQFDDELRRAMRTETEMFFSSAIRDDRSLLDFLTADFTYVNERLAKHYGIADIQGDQFRRVPLDERRRGILTHGSILLLTSNPGRTSPVKRGKWILDNILGEPPSPPPEDVAELEEDADEIGSLRERMEQHRSNEACAICHRKMDALGFGLENFDAIGAWRDQDGKFAIDASGTLPGNVAFRGPAQLMTILAERKTEEFCRCLTKKNGNLRPRSGFGFVRPLCREYNYEAASRKRLSL